MKKYIIYTILAISALASCQKNLIDETPAISSSQTLIVSVQPNDEPQSRVALTDGASNVTLDWESDDSFTLYTTDGERVVDFKYANESNDGRILFTSADENVKLSDNENYIAIYPSVEGVTTLDTHRAELESRLSEQTQTGNNSNSHLENALRMETEFTYCASSDTKVTFEHQMATMRLTFATENGAIPTKIIFSDGDFMNYTVNLDGVTKASTYTAHFVIKPNEIGEKRDVSFNVYNESTRQEFSKTSNAIYHAGVQYRSTLGSEDLSDAVYLIYNKSDLINFRDQVNAGNININAILMADIDLAGENWTPIGIESLTNLFSGTFDGQNHTISNLTINRDSNSQGLFGYVGGYDGGGIISNLILKNPQVSGGSWTGALCGYLDCYGVIENCGVEGGSVTGTYCVGGAIGRVYKATVTSCYNKSSVKGKEDIQSIGGVVGQAQTSSTISDCYNDGDVNGDLFAGGVVGYNTSSSSVTSCYNTGNITGDRYIGGVIGYNLSYASVSDCCNKGKVSGSVYIGGVVGYSENGVGNCYNTGDISGSSDVGGVVGYAAGVVRCSNTGSVSGVGNTGGVAGYSEGGADECCNTGSVYGGYGLYTGGVIGENGGNVYACYNRGSVSSAGSYLGGIVGHNIKYCIITACYNTGEINNRTTNASSGGITGYFFGYHIESCYNTGLVSGGGDYSSLGGIVPYTNEGVYSCYYLPYEDVAYTDHHGTADPNLITRMKSQETVLTLNTAAGETYWGYDSNNKNNGYPILVNIDYE